MGREIRRVPPNWKHPEKNGEYIPLFDQSYKEAVKYWDEQNDLWEDGNHEDQRQWPEQTRCSYAEWAGSRPVPEDYRPEFTVEPTWFQVYETVTEGTPVTPPFETKSELVEYLVRIGTFWDKRGWPRENAEAFVESEWAPSLIMSGNVIKRPSQMNAEDLGLKGGRDG